MSKLQIIAVLGSFFLIIFAGLMGMYNETRNVQADSIYPELDTKKDVQSFLDIDTMRQYEGSAKYTRMYDTKYDIICYGISEYDKTPHTISCVQLR